MADVFLSAVVDAGGWRRVDFGSEHDERAMMVSGLSSKRRRALQDQAFLGQHAAHRALRHLRPRPARLPRPHRSHRHCARTGPCSGRASLQMGTRRCRLVQCDWPSRRGRTCMRSTAGRRGRPGPGPGSAPTRSPRRSPATTCRRPSHTPGPGGTPVVAAGVRAPRVPVGSFGGLIQRLGQCQPLDQASCCAGSRMHRTGLNGGTDAAKAY